MVKRWSRCGIISSLIIGEITRISEHSTRGDLSYRGSDAGLSGEYKYIIEGRMGTLEGVVVPVTEAMRLASGYAKGDFTERFNPSLQAGFCLLPHFS